VQSCCAAAASNRVAGASSGSVKGSHPSFGVTLIDDRFQDQALPTLRHHPVPGRRLFHEIAADESRTWRQTTYPAEVIWQQQNLWSQAANHPRVADRDTDEG
jgi:hypothetical protein